MEVIRGHLNSDTHEVEGILVRGEADFVQQGTCPVSLVCPTTGCRGEDCTRTTEFAQFIELQWDHISHANDVVAMAAINGKLFAATRDNRLWWRDPVR